jgi:hypothetical protein
MEHITRAKLWTKHILGKWVVAVSLATIFISSITFWWDECIAPIVHMERPHIIEWVATIPVPYRTIFCAVVIAVLAVEGAFGAIRNSESETEAKEEEVKELTSQLRVMAEELNREREKSFPEFRLNVLTWITAPTPQHWESNQLYSGQTALANLELELMNGRTPSVAVNWQCAVVIGGVRYAGQLVNWPDGLTLIDLVPPLTIRTENLIPNRTHVPVGTGSRTIGWLSIFFSGPLREQLDSAEPVWIFSFEDVRGETHTFEKQRPLDWGEVKKNLAHQPGRT